MKCVYLLCSNQYESFTSIVSATASPTLPATFLRIPRTPTSSSTAKPSATSETSTVKTLQPHRSPSGAAPASSKSLSTAAPPQKSYEQSATTQSHSVCQFNLGASLECG